MTNNEILQLVKNNEDISHYIKGYGDCVEGDPYKPSDIHEMIHRLNVH